MRLNYYVNEYVVLRSYFRYYQDDWGVKSNTLQLEPHKIQFGPGNLFPSIVITIKRQRLILLLTIVIYLPMIFIPQIMI